MMIISKFIIITVEKCLIYNDQLTQLVYEIDSETYSSGFNEGIIKDNYIYIATNEKGVLIINNNSGDFSYLKPWFWDAGDKSTMAAETISFIFTKSIPKIGISNIGSGKKTQCKIFRFFENACPVYWFIAFFDAPTILQLERTEFFYGSVDTPRLYRHATMSSIMS